KRTGDLAVDLGRVDGIGRIGRRDEPVDLDLAAGAFDGDFRGRRYVGVEGFHVGKAAVYAGGRWRVPADTLCHRIEHREVARMLAQKLAAEFELVLTNRLSELIHEAFEENAVLIDIHSAPEARQDMRVAHGVIDQQVVDRVTEGMLLPLTH